MGMATGGELARTTRGELVRTPEAARRLGISTRELWAMIDEDLVPAVLVEVPGHAGRWGHVNSRYIDRLARALARDGDQTDPEHGGHYLRDLRRRACLSIDQVAERAGVEPAWLTDVEARGTRALLYSQIAAVVRATQPPRPPWWDEGHEHDLLLGPNGRPARQLTEHEEQYWANIDEVRATIRAGYADGEPPPS